jgi:gamma-glutamylcysteine synthetase
MSQENDDSKCVVKTDLEIKKYLREKKYYAKFSWVVVYKIASRTLFPTDAWDTIIDPFIANSIQNK